MSNITVRPVVAGDREAWERLYRGYRDFYLKPHDPRVLTTVWGWLMDPQHHTRGLVAVCDGELIGLGHYRTFARPIDGGSGLYLDDLFTAPEARGTGAAAAILTRLASIAHDEGASIVRWITADTNEVAMRLYDGVAKKTSWVTYDLGASVELRSGTQVD